MIDNHQGHLKSLMSFLELMENSDIKPSIIYIYVMQIDDLKRSYSYLCVENNKQQIKTVFPSVLISEKERNIYISGTEYMERFKFEQLDLLDIKAVVNLSKSSLLKAGMKKKLNDLSHLVTNIKDIEESKKSDLIYFKQIIGTTLKILTNTDHKNILLVCENGNNLSCGVLVHYLMHEKRLPLQKAVDSIKEARPCIGLSFYILDALRDLFETKRENMSTTDRSESPFTYSSNNKFIVLFEELTKQQMGNKSLLESTYFTILKYITNIIEHPRDTKYKKIKKVNKVFQEKISKYSKATEILYSFGFSYNATDEAYTLPDDISANYIKMKKLDLMAAYNHIYNQFTEK